MKILHTADWHLGAKLENRSREDEHAAALRWLLATIVAEKVNILIVAGDIFDAYNPPNYAERLYYNFIKELSKTDCHTAIICAGNHDSPPKLEAARAILDIFNVKIIAQIPDNFKKHIIEIYNPKNNELQAVVAAVPFLTDSFLRQSRPAETSEERIAQMRKGIEAYYQKMAELCAVYTPKNIPIITTGHLAVAQADKNNRQRYNSIHLGTLDIVGTECFAPIFDYVALGHLHYPHKVGENEHIRYAGSLIALDFGETLHPQQVYVLEFAQKKMLGYQSFANPHKRDLLLWSGTAPEIEKKIANYQPANLEFKAWLRLEIISPNGYDTTLRDKIVQQIATLPLELIGEPRLRRQIDPNWEAQQEASEQIDLQTLQPKDIFARKLQAMNYNEPKTAKLLDLFDELLIWHDEKQRNNE